MTEFEAPTPKGGVTPDGYVRLVRNRDILWKPPRAKGAIAVAPGGGALTVDYVPILQPEGAMGLDRSRFPAMCPPEEGACRARARMA